MANCRDESVSKTGLEESFESLYFETESSSQLEEVSNSLPSHELPSCTSYWQMSDLEAVGVYYDSDFKSIIAIIDMIHGHTGMFPPLTEPQKERGKMCQDRITMSSSVDEIFLTGRQMADLCLQKITENLQHRVRDENLFISMEEDFIRNIVVMVKLAAEKDDAKRNVSKAVFIDFFKSFVKMCGLIPISGDEWNSTKKILHQGITSAADIVIHSEDYLDYSSSKTAVSVVSVAEVQYMKYYKTCKTKWTNDNDEKQKANERPMGETSSREGDNYPLEEPLIFKRVAKSVLAQHGGELLLHSSIYSSKYIDEQRKCYLLPGLIVIGTQVIFTLLEYNFDHIREVENDGDVEASRSYIYYSEPKDLLKKEDRDLLIESFMRLCNVT